MDESSRSQWDLAKADLGHRFKDSAMVSILPAEGWVSSPTTGVHTVSGFHLTALGVWAPFDSEGPSKGGLMGV